MTTKTSLMGVILYVLVVSPIWFYLMYKILEAINASELTWFLYYVYVPVSIITYILLRLGDDT